MNKWSNMSLSLGERCVLFAENELKSGVKEDAPKSYTSKRIREYFSICTRLKNGKEVPINLTKGNWCAASASFCLYSCLLNGETKPHGFRVGVVEIVEDLKASGLYRPIKEVLNKTYSPKIGDVIIFDRSNPNDPSTAWFRHIGRVYDLNLNSFDCISGNSGGKWAITKHKYTQSNLLGFGQYPLHNEAIGTVYPNIQELPDDNIINYDSGSELASDDFYKLWESLNC